jgi:hypothetical protein
MSISSYFRPNIHQNSPEILGVNLGLKKKMKRLKNYQVIWPENKNKIYVIKSNLTLT